MMRSLFLVETLSSQDQRIGKLHIFLTKFLALWGFGSGEILGSSGQQLSSCYPVRSITLVLWLLGPITCITYSAELHRLFVGLENGTVVEYDVAEDLNHIEHKRDYLSHTARTTGIVCTPDMGWVVSASKDRTVAWYSTNSGRRICEHNLEHSATCLE